MSFKVLVIPEDPSNDSLILKPLIRRMMSACGKPQSQVFVLTRPRVQGYDDAKEALRKEVFSAYPYIDLFLFLPDADGKDRTEEFKGLEAEAVRQGSRLICCAAKQEVETWLLAGHLKRKFNANWADVQREVSVKEMYFEPFLREHGNPKAVGWGREQLMNEALEQFDGILQRCPELAELKEKITSVLNERG